MTLEQFEATPSTGRAARFALSDCFLTLLHGMAIVGLVAMSSGLTAGEPLPYAPIDQYERRVIEGFQVLVLRPFVQHEPAECQATLAVLGQHLLDIGRRVPGPALAQLRQVRIWVERDEPHHRCMAYHPNAEWLRNHGMNPEKAGCVEIANAENFRRWTLDQPAMVLHELAHGYHDRFLPGGYRNAEIAAAYRRMKEAGLYKSVLHTGGKKQAAYALTNPMEYFAESTEAYFGTNDFYPFVRAELREHDRAMYDLLRRLWRDEG